MFFNCGRTNMGLVGRSWSKRFGSIRIESRVSCTSYLYCWSTKGVPIDWFGKVLKRLGCTTIT